MNEWINFLYTRRRKIGLRSLHMYTILLAAQINYFKFATIESSSQQALMTYRGLVPFNFQHLENNLKPFELLMVPSSDETSLSMIMIVKCDQNKCHRKRQVHPPSLIWFEYVARKDWRESTRDARAEVRAAFARQWLSCFLLRQLNRWTKQKKVKNNEVSNEQRLV